MSNRVGRVSVWAFLALGALSACAGSEEPLKGLPSGGQAGVGALGGGGSNTGGAGCVANGASSGQGASGQGASGQGASGQGASGGQGASPGAGASGQGASAGSGASAGCTGLGGAAGSGGTGGGGPPQCDDSLKRCQQAFTYPAGSETSVELRGDFAPDGWTVGVPLAKQGSTWSADVEVPYNVDVQYKFLIDGTQWVTDPGNPNTISDGMGGQNSLMSAVTCTDYTCVPPPTIGYDWRDAILYFVFVDRFYDGDPSNNGPAIAGSEPATSYKGGDWAGVRQKLKAGYFSDLGVNTLWLSVPVDNPEVTGIGTDGHQYTAYHAYWPMNLDKPEERFGTLAELQGLVSDAHAAGIKVILDYAMNHVHISSPVYAQHADWFWPLDFNGQSCVCGTGSCQYDGPQAKRCWFASYLPDFNFTVTDARNYSVGNAVQWIKDTGVDGFRLDAVKHIEDSWVTDLRARVTSEIEPTSKQHFYMVGETFTGDRNAIKYYVDPVKMLDGQFDFPLRAQLIKSILIRSAPMSDLDGFLGSNDNFYGSGVMSTFVGNHDVPRSIHFAEDNPMWGNEWADGKDRSWTNQPGLPGGTSAFERLGNAYTLIFTLKGVPLIYYGDEIGMPGAGDPDNRRMMQWSGLSAGQSALLDHVKKLSQIRAGHEALRKGNRTTLSVSTDTYAYKMQYNADTVFVVINRGDSAQSVGNLPSGALKDLLSGNSVTGPTLSVPARSSLVLTQ